MSMRVLAASAAFAAILSGSAVAAAPSTPPAPAPSVSKAFDAKIGATKAAMMADPHAGLKSATEALAMARAAPASDVQALSVATAQWLQGEAYTRLNDLAKAVPIIDEALAVATRLAPNSKLQGDLMLSQGAALAVRGQVQPALEDFQKAHNIFAAAGQPRSQAKALQMIGTIYQDAGDYDRVLQYYAQSAEAYAGDPALLLSAHNNKANAYRNQGKLDAAVAEYREALVLARKMGSPMLEATIYSNLAAAEVLAGKLDAGEADVARGLAVTARDPGAKETPFLWGVYAQAALARGHVAEARARIERTFAGVDLATTSPKFRDFHHTAYQIYDRLGDTPRALAHLEAFKRLDDEARTLTASTNAALMAARFDFANQDLKITKLKAGQLERDAQLAKSRSMILIGLLSGVSIVLALLLVGFFSLRRSRNEVRAANANLSSANTSLEKALKAKTEFLATTSHEIRTPLNGILGMTQVLLADRKVEASIREKIELVHGAGETMRALVDDILDVAKIENGSLTVSRAEMDLRRVLDDTARLWTEQASTKGLALELSAEAAPTRIVEDETRLRQILFNLMSNAIKFTETGKVSLAVDVETLEAGERLVLRLSDTGIGIPADKLEEIFESFCQVDGATTRKYGGTGLGLTICRNLAEALGGTIGVESVIGEGSVFTVRLPLERAAEPEVQAPCDGPAGLGQCAVLLVEANPLNQSVMRAVLSSEVQALEIVGSGEAALMALTSHSFDLVVADAASAAIAGADAATAIARLSAAARGALLAAILPAGSAAEPGSIEAARVLVKPVTPADLVEALRGLCEARSRGEAPQPAASEAA